jgi:hypothetical protein
VSSHATEQNIVPIKVSVTITINASISSSREKDDAIVHATIPENSDPRTSRPTSVPASIARVVAVHKLPTFLLKVRASTTAASITMTTTLRERHCW